MNYHAVAKTACGRLTGNNEISYSGLSDVATGLYILTINDKLIIYYQIEYFERICKTSDNLYKLCIYNYDAWSWPCTHNKLFSASAMRTHCCIEKLIHRERK